MNAKSGGVDAFLSRVSERVGQRLHGIAAELALGIDIVSLSGGKMLRSRLVFRLGEAGASGRSLDEQVTLCAAAEMAHTASLFHDDVIDNAALRRSRPALWTVAGASGAVLLGDVVLCEALSIVTNAFSEEMVRRFVSKMREMCLAETLQELSLRGKRVDDATCLRVARTKTGPLFAFLARACAPERERGEALEEAGYRIGTAYQLSDDLLDDVSANGRPDKTVGTDLSRRKFTLAHAQDGGSTARWTRVQELFAEALDVLKDDPRARSAVARFLAQDMQPVLNARSDSPIILEGTDL